MNQYRQTPPVIFVTGIDTNIGKTYATAMLQRQLSERGYKVITQKFIQTGNRGYSEDIDRHRALLGEKNLPADLAGLTAPIIFSYPASPHLAAKIDGLDIDLSLATEATRRLHEEYGYDIVLVEGAGGIMVPITEGYLTIDYIREQGYPVAIVTSGRLGSINHTLLTIEACLHRDIKIHALIYNRYPTVDEVIEQDTLEYLKRYMETHIPMTELLILDEWQL